MLLEINPLVMPSLGLVVWTSVAFIFLVIVLKKYAWKPILSGINQREKSIEETLQKAESLRKEMAAMQNESDALIQKAREERTVMLKETREMTDKLIGEAKNKAKSEYEKIIEQAQDAIEKEKNAAINDVKNQVGKLVIEVSEKVLRKELTNNQEQQSYINQLTQSVKLN